MQASSVDEGRFPKVSAAYDVPVCVLGLMLRHVCLEAGVPALDDASDLFVVKMCERVRGSFDAMRAQAERRRAMRQRGSMRWMWIRRTMPSWAVRPCAACWMRAASQLTFGDLSEDSQCE